MMVTQIVMDRSKLQFTLNVLDPSPSDAILTHWHKLKGSTQSNITHRTFVINAQTMNVRPTWSEKAKYHETMRNGFNSNDKSQENKDILTQNDPKREEFLIFCKNV